MHQKNVVNNDLTYNFVSNIIWKTPWNGLPRGKIIVAEDYWNYKQKKCETETQMYVMLHMAVEVWCGCISEEICACNAHTRISYSDYDKNSTFLSSKVLTSKHFNGEHMLNSAKNVYT